MTRDSIKVRNFNPSVDFPAYIELLDVHNGKDNKTTEQEQHDYADMLTIDLETDRLVVEHPESSDKIIAVCDIWRISQNPSADLMLLVHPDYRRKGVGSLLFEAALEHANTIKARAIDAYSEPDNTEVRAFLERLGFRVVSHCTGMSIKTEASFPKSNLPVGYTVKTYAELEGSEVEKLDLIVKASNEFWGVLWGHKVTHDIGYAREVVKKNVLAYHTEDAMFFLFKEDTYIGHDRVSFSETSDGTKQGYGGGVPGLRPDYYKPELAREFALIGLEYLHAQGCHNISFTVIASPVHASSCK